MSTILPVGLTQFVPSNGTVVPIMYTDITSITGTVGPLTLQISNPSNSASALFSYSAELNPQPPGPPITYHNVYVNPGVGGTEAYVDIDVVPGVSATVTTIVSSTGSWTGDAGTVLGADIGGATPDNNLLFLAVTDISGTPTAFTYLSGVIPGTPPAPTAVAPTLGSPTKVVSIPPLGTILIQIPSTSASLSDTPIDLVASGANLYVTPVQIVA